LQWFLPMMKKHNIINLNGNTVYFTMTILVSGMCEAIDGEPNW